MEVRPGSMGKPLPGIDAGIVSVAQDGAVTVVPPGSVGQLALRPGWPSMFRGYLHEDQRYAKCFAGGWYLTGDLARRDDDGYYWFVGRSDDVIKSAGHLIGPFEVESALLMHRAVAEAARITVPGGRVLILDLREHREEWVRAKLGDRTLGFNDGELKHMLAEAGLSDVRVGVGARKSGDPFTVLIASASKPAAVALPTSAASAPRAARAQKE
jgi:acyl-CoA synthetase (AMP-forming)/AMP-acid ligase II